MFEQIFHWIQKSECVREMLLSQYPKIAATMIGAWLHYYLVNKNPCIVDVGYTVSHLVVGTSLALSYAGKSLFKPLILWSALGLWCARLAGYLYATRASTQTKDARYESIVGKIKWRDAFFFANFQFQAMIVVITSSTLYWVFRKPDFTNYWTFIPGLAMIATGIIGESMMDRQLERWKKDHSGKGEILEEGLWKKSRHPNLFFELVTWFGFALTGVNNQRIELLSFVGPVFLYLLMRFVTIPITEKQMKKTRENYPQYLARTNMFLPF